MGKPTPTKLGQRQDYETDYDSDMTGDLTQRGQKCIMDNLSVWMNYGHIMWIQEAP